MMKMKNDKIVKMEKIKSYNGIKEIKICYKNN